jgi:hypothetical protein
MASSVIECMTCGGAIPSRWKTDLASLQMSRRQGICRTPALTKKASKGGGTPGACVLSPLQAHDGLALLLGCFFRLENSKRLVRRDRIGDISERGRLD